MKVLQYFVVLVYMNYPIVSARSINTINEHTFIVCFKIIGFEYLLHANLLFIDEVSTKLFIEEVISILSPVTIINCSLHNMHRNNWPATLVSVGFFLLFPQFKSDFRPMVFQF